MSIALLLAYSDRLQAPFPSPIPHPPHPSLNIQLTLRSHLTILMEC